MVLVKANRIIPSTYALTPSLLIDFVINDADKNWAGSEEYLRELFERVVCCEKIPNCVVKVNVFVLNRGE